MALVLTLGAMAVNPALHAWVHDAQSGCGHHHHQHDSTPTQAADGDHVCAATLFAQGLTLVAPVTIPPAAAVVWSESFPVAVEESLLPAPRSRHAPPCGPPLV